MLFQEEEDNIRDGNISDTRMTVSTQGTCGQLSGSHLKPQHCRRRRSPGDGTGYVWCHISHSPTWERRPSGAREAVLQRLLIMWPASTG